MSRSARLARIHRILSKPELTTLPAVARSGPGARGAGCRRLGRQEAGAAQLGCRLKLALAQHTAALWAAAVAQRRRIKVEPCAMLATGRAWCAARCATTMPRVCTVPLIVRQCKKRERMGASGARGRPGAQATPRAGRHHAACLAPDACLFRRRKKVKCACRVWHPKAPALTRRAARSASRAA